MRAAMSSIVLLVLAACTDAPETADRVFIGGVIHTGVEGAPPAEMVAVKDGGIIFAGPRAEGESYIGRDSEIVDLGGAVMFPGFTDSHAHIVGVGQREMVLNLEGAQSVADMQARVRSAAQESVEGVIFGRGWIETHWPEGRFPSAADLDAVENERPVVLVRADGHALVANTAAMTAAGVTPDTPDPEGGAILKDEDGRPNGMFIDTAMAPLTALAGSLEGEARERAYETGALVMAASGWTGVHDMSAPYADVGILARLAGEGRLAVRVAVYSDADDYHAVAARTPRVEADGRVIARGVKFYMDGALGSRGAALIEPYDDSPETSGLFLARRDEAQAMLRRALEDGVQIAAHAIGDAGNRRLLDWMEESFEAVPEEARAVPDPRWRVEHAQVLAPRDIPRFAQLDVIASMQPSHAIGDLHFAPSRIGLQRLEGAYAWRSLVESGAMIAGGSDAPVERGEARIEFYAAAVRRDLDGYAGEGWNLDQALDRETALKLFTIWPAYVSFREHELGTIEPGKLADFSVFDRDLMSVPDLELREARPVMTVVNGEIVWRAQD